MSYKERFLSAFNKALLPPDEPNLHAELKRFRYLRSKRRIRWHLERTETVEVSRRVCECKCPTQHYMVVCLGHELEETVCPITLYISLERIFLNTRKDHKVHFGEIFVEVLT